MSAKTPSETDSAGKAGATADRKARLAAQLRANLRRRKDQARQRRENDTDDT